MKFFPCLVEYSSSSSSDCISSCSSLDSRRKRLEHLWPKYNDGMCSLDNLALALAWLVRHLRRGQTKIYCRQRHTEDKTGGTRLGYIGLVFSARFKLAP
ncbi:unnamed protein product, partial [Heterotrigona itama]